MTHLKFVLAAIVTAGLIGCNDEIDVKDIPDDAITGPLTVDIGGDATRDGGNTGAVPDTVDSIFLRLDEVSIMHETEGWVFIDDGRQDIDLMAERDGDSVQVGEGDVYIGNYDLLRLSITDAWIIVDGVELDLIIGNGVALTDGLDLTVAMDVNESTSTAVWVGWDLDTTLSVDGDVWTLGTDVNATVNVE